MKTSTFVLALALGATRLAAPTNAAAKEQISEEARSYFRNGVELLQASPPNYQDAYYQFKLAFDKSNSWKVLGNMGLCALNLERDGEALRYYEDYLKRGGKEIDKDERAAIERDMLLVRGNAATIEVNSVGGEEVELLDVRAGSPVPGQAYVIGSQKQTLTLRAGTHTLTATHKDGRSLKWEILLRPSKSASHEFDFNAPPPAAPETQPAAPQPPTPPQTVPVDATPTTSSGSPLRTAGFVTGGVGLAIVASGVVTGLMAKSKEREVDDKCAATPDGCDPSLKSTLHSAANLAKVTNVLLIGGGVVTLAGIGMIAFGGKTSTQVGAARVTLVPVVAGNAGGLFATGSF
ncbi:MAG: hypothetical protein QM756_04885 [Polyangiaceae bacterium]